MENSASYFINKLKLKLHTEGGYYTQIYEDNSIIKVLDKNEDNKYKSTYTIIYYLLKENNFSSFHKIKSNESWHYYAGNTKIKIYEIKDNGELTIHNLGNNLEKGDNFVSVIEKNSWIAAELYDKNNNNFALVGCNMAPGFNYNDFELGNSKLLINKFPQYTKIIKRLTKEKQIHNL